MKTTTYLIAGLAVCGAVVTGVAAATIANIRTDLAPIDFTSELTTLTLPQAPVIVLDQDDNPADNIHISHMSPFFLTVEESDSVSTPQLTMSETWAGMITSELRGDTLYITADFHSLKEHFTTLSRDETAWVDIFPNDVTLTLPAGMTRSLNADIRGSHVILNGFDTDSFKIISDQDMSITDSRFGLLALGTSPYMGSHYRYRRDVEIKNVKCDSTNIDVTYFDYNLSGPARLGDVTINTTALISPDADSEIPGIIIGSSLIYNDLKMTGDAMCLISLPMRPGEQVKRMN